MISTPLHKYTARPDAELAPIDPDLAIPPWPATRPKLSDATRWRIVAHAMGRAQNSGGMR